MYPNICVRLRGTPVRLEEFVRGCSHEMLVLKQGEKWSAQEHAGHLLDLEALWFTRAQEYSGSGGELSVADLTNRRTFEANHNARPIGELLAEFREARRRLVECVQEMEASVFGRSLTHPRLKKPMRLVDHLYFVAEHDDHHLAWIWELTHV